MNNNTSGMMAARPGAGPSTGGGDGGAGVSVGNYKGVMLCNRPFAGLVAPHGHSSDGNSRARQKVGDTMPPFLPSGPHQNDCAGLNPIRTRPFVLDVLSKEKKDSVNHKHRRFIKKLQKEKRKQKEEGMEEEKQRENKLTQFREKQRQMRLKVVAIMQQREGSNQTDSSEEKNSERRDSSDRQARHVAVPESDNANNDEMQAKLERTLGSSAKSKGGNKKPMWAMTSDAAEEKEEQDVDDLVSFARSLDFEEFLSDLEVKTAMEAMRKRIHSLKKKSHKIRDESKYADGDDDDGEESVDYEGRYGSDDVLGDISQEFLQLVQGRAASIAGREEGYDRDSEADEARDTVGMGLRNSVHQFSGSGDDVSVADAKSIMSTASVQSMRSIHSTRSITRLAKDAMKRIEAEEKAQQQCDADGVVPPKRVEIVLAPPRIVDIVEDGGTRLSKKSDVNNLPYMHRNPAI